jgi:hypothetical protein
MPDKPQDTFKNDEHALRMHPELRRHPSLKPGQWRFDPEYGREQNPTTFAEKYGYGTRVANPAPPPDGDTGGVTRRGRR